MSFLGRLLGFFSVLANLALGLAMLAMGLIGSLDGGPMKVGILPVAPESVATTLMLSGLGALVAVVLAIRPGRASRTPLVLWSVLVVSILICALTRPSFRFDGEEHFHQFLWSLGGAVLLLIGSIVHWKLAPARKRA